jgi:hypothetical protein
LASLYVQLSGGLGNQMFQYATSRAYAIEKGLDLKLDEHSGFVNDKQYKRTYSLGVLPITGKSINQIERVPLWLFRIQNKLCGLKSGLKQLRWYGVFFTEHKWIYHGAEIELDTSKNFWLIGYWQSHKYFQNYEGLIQRELMPPKPRGRNFVKLASNMQASDSVAIGVRLYEESENPSAHALHGRVKSVEEINQAILRVQEQRPNAKFFIFCTHRSTLLNKLKVPGNSIFVTPEDGFIDAAETLWLITRCKHHIFTNSSYYWWGAWLSHAVHKKEEQLIYAADNFINVDGLCDHWLRF